MAALLSACTRIRANGINDDMALSVVGSRKAEAQSAARGIHKEPHLSSLPHLQLEAGKRGQQRHDAYSQRPSPTYPLYLTCSLRQGREVEDRGGTACSHRDPHLRGILRVAGTSHSAHFTLDASVKQRQALHTHCTPRSMHLKCSNKALGESCAWMGRACMRIA
eukprot:1158457-Pelagomonas_calceolata.AAC.4